MRVLTYSHDSFGLGHLRRSLTLAHAFVSRDRTAQALCITGSPVPELFGLPERCDLLKLPAITKDEAGNYVPRSLRMPFAELVQLRSDLITAAVRSFRPHLVLVDHTAQGAGGELLPVLRRIRSELVQTRVVLGMRDIYDDPARAHAEFSRRGTSEAIANLYDHVLVYGQRGIAIEPASYGLPESVASRTSHVGAVVAPEAHRLRLQRGPGPLHILGTAGGGEDGYDLLRSVVAAVRGPMADRDLRATVVAGPLLPPPQWESLQRAAAGDDRIQLVRTTRAMHELMDHADLVIGMGGYNTVYETLARGLPMLAWPRVKPRREQIERCTRLAALGALVVMPHEAVQDPHAVSALVEQAAEFRPNLDTLRFDGAAQAASECLAVHRPMSTAGK